MLYAATDPAAFSILEQVVREGELSESDASDQIARLHEVGFLSQRRGRRAGDLKTWYVPTSMGALVVEVGPEEGVRQLANAELDF
jgi:hypothetical protein